MPDSLVNEFFNQRDAGEPFRKSLKNAVFQAKSRIGDAQNYEDPEAGPKFQLWKIDMRGLDDDDPVYVQHYINPTIADFGVAIGGSHLQQFLYWQPPLVRWLMLPRLLRWV
jgi:hypothetical protein